MTRKNETSAEIPENKDWHAAVHAAKVQGKSLYFVNTICGQTVDVCLSESLAWSYIQKTRAPRHQFRVYERNPFGMMFLCRR